MKTILTIIDGDEGNVNRLDTTIKLAKKFKAHVSGLHIFPQLEPYVHTSSYAGFATGPGLIYPPNFFQTRKKEMKGRAKELFKNFKSQMTRARVKCNEHSVEGDRLKIMNSFSRCADVTVISQGTDGLDDITTTDTAFMLESGLPVLAVPETAVHSKIGDNILVAWNGSAQAARATFFALPLLKQAEKVVILSVGEKDWGPVKLEDLSSHLARHDVPVIFEQKEKYATPGETIIGVAEANNIDLIVAGAWGHSRITELIMGGTTNSLFVNQKYPIFFAH